MFLVGIAGGSGSGKTTFAKKILKCIQMEESQEQVAILHQDSYYLPSPAQHLKVHGVANFDHPEAFDWPFVKAQLEALKQGKSIDTPVYDFKMNRRAAETVAIGPCKAVLLEGIYSLWDSEIRGLLDLKIYLHVEADIRFIRRLHRDVKERGRTVDSVIRQYYDTVRPMHHEFLEPTKKYADFIVGEETDLAAEIVASRIREILLKKS